MKEEEFVTALVAAAADAGEGDRGGSWDLMYFTPGKMSKKRGRVSFLYCVHSHAQHATHGRVIYIRTWDRLRALSLAKIHLLHYVRDLLLCRAGKNVAVCCLFPFTLSCRVSLHATTISDG